MFSSSTLVAMSSPFGPRVWPFASTKSPLPIWPAVKRRALGPMAEYYEQLKARVDGYPDDPQGDSGGPAYQREERIAGKAYQMPIAAAAKR